MKILRFDAVYAQMTLYSLIICGSPQVRSNDFQRRRQQRWVYLDVYGWASTRTRHSFPKIVIPKNSPPAEPLHFADQLCSLPCDSVG